MIMQIVVSRIKIDYIWCDIEPIRICWI